MRSEGFIHSITGFSRSLIGFFYLYQKYSIAIPSCLCTNGSLPIARLLLDETFILLCIFIRRGSRWTRTGHLLATPRTLLHRSQAQGVCGPRDAKYFRQTKPASFQRQLNLLLDQPLATFSCQLAIPQQQTTLLLASRYYRDSSSEVPSGSTRRFHSEF